MGSDRSRVLLLALAYVALVALSLFFLPWFELDAGGGRLTIDLRHATACAGPACASVELGAIPKIGMYPSMAWSTFWGALLVSLVVLFQAGTRVATGVANPRLSRMGLFGCLSVLTSAAATAYLFAPEAGPGVDLGGPALERTISPLLLILGQLAGVFAVHYAALQTTADDVGEYRPVVVARPAGAPPAAAPPPASLPAALPRAIAAPPALPRTAAAEARPRSGPTIPPIPAHLEKRLRYLIRTAELTRAGVDARREDGGSVLVLWRDVVGVIARRLPPALDGEPFVDVISTPGATLRVLPWTRLTGEPLDGDGDARARALVTFLAGRCPDARIDPATRAFAADTAPAEQIASEADLATYDARLA